MALFSGGRGGRDANPKETEMALTAKVQKPIWQKDARGCTFSDSYELVDVRVGDCVGFKADVEQHGRIVEIRASRYMAAELVLENENGFPGDYLRYATRCVQLASDCWVE
jgi:hypothetical protein